MTQGIPTAATDPSGSQSAKRATVAAGIGTFVEYYDFVVYAYLASVIGPLFFPGATPIAAMLLTFGAFASSWAVRPLGAMIFGPLGDTHGRRNVLATVILIMSAATALIGLLPTHAAIGVAAPILLTLLRLVQGISVGGEFGGATAYVAEFAPPKRRGLFLSWLPFSSGLGLLGGALVVTAVSAAVPADAMASWGWRIPFLLALPLGAVGVYLRLRVQDTPVFTEAKRGGNVTVSPLRTSLRTEAPGILLTIGATAALTVGTYVFLIYTPSYLTTVLGYDRTTSLLANIAATTAFCIALPFMGALSDRVGRKPVLVVGSTLFAVLAYPSFLLMSGGETLWLVLALALLGLLNAVVFASALPILPEVFATATRNTSLGLGWNITSTLFGGSAPLIATALIATSGNVAAPAFIVIVGGVLSLVTALVVRETASTSLRDASESAPSTDSATR